MLLSLSASAYELLDYQWSWQDHPIEDAFSLDAASFPDDAGTEAELEDALTTAMSSWNDAGQDLELRYDTLVTGSAEGTDGHLYVRYEDLDDMGGALAYAATWAWDASTMFDCDITFLADNDYGAIYWDADAAGPGSGRYDMQAVALHELGHCLGLNHSADSSAVMYAYYYGVRTLQADDLDGLAAIYGDPCVDGDGDGYSDCDADCDDANAAINPGATEVCDGVDNNCDGAVDAAALTTVAPASTLEEADTSWSAAGNAYTVEAPTRLLSWTQHMDVPTGDRLIWSVSVADTKAGPWTIVRTEISYAVAGDWQSSPTIDLPLEVGKVYAVSLGALSTRQTFWYDKVFSSKTYGPLTTEGAVTMRALADEGSTPTFGYQFDQLLTVEDVADADADGQTVLCGDCDDGDATRATTIPEACDGVDNDCDGEADEDFAADSDSDGTIDCLDVCPEDPADDADGDGTCADVDPCPDDPADTCDDDTGGDSGIDTAGDSGIDTGAPEETGRPDSPDDPEDSAIVADTGKEEPGGCGCASGRVGYGAGILLGFVTLRARRRAR